jgi:hypothetical protein
VVAVVPLQQVRHHHAPRPLIRRWWGGCTGLRGCAAVQLPPRGLHRDRQRRLCPGPRLFPLPCPLWNRCLGDGTESGCSRGAAQRGEDTPAGLDVDAHRPEGEG